MNDDKLKQFEEELDERMERISESRKRLEKDPVSISGREFLEKVMQVVSHMPLPTRDRIHYKMILTKIYEDTTGDKLEDVDYMDEA